jgi:NUMOD3 motif
MNYGKVYNQIIERAKSQIRDGYLERHHIVPKCLGGSNDISNLVLLTAREHYLCHWLIAKQTNDKRLWLAFSMMSISSDKHQRIRSSRLFERAKIARSYAMLGNNNPMFGKKSACTSHTEETKNKIRISKLGKKRGSFSRSAATQETKNKISIAQKGKIPHNKGKVTSKFKCTHCNKMIDIANMKRWHGDNCKSKNQFHCSG